MLAAFLPGIGPQEMVVIAIFGVLLFGKRLPEVGRSLGKGIAEFRRSVSGIEDEFRSIGRTVNSNSVPSSSSSTSSTRSSSAYSPPPVTNDLAPDPTVPKFEPPTSAPVPRVEGDRPAVGSHPYAD